jgi:cell division protein ZapA
MPDKSGVLQVEIFGQTYTVRAGSDPQYVELLAAHVNAEMLEVSRTGGAVDSMRVAVLAALNISDECFRLRAEVAALQRRASVLAETLSPLVED